MKSLRKYPVTESVNAELLQFLTTRLGNPTQAITTQSGIEETFGIAEPDTIVLYQDFIQHFNIALPPDWDISNHTSPSVFHHWKYYWKKLVSKQFRVANQYSDLTIGDLETMIRSGRWVGT